MKMAHSSMVFVMTFLGLLVFAIAIEQAPESIEVMDGKSEEINTNKRPSFFVGSRYGRSYGNSKSGRVNVAPRNDRFFLGSRYGKRNSDYLSGIDSERERQEQQQQDFYSLLSSSSSNRSKFFTMTCVHIGFKNFFRCNAVNDINNFIQHLSNEDQ